MSDPMRLRVYRFGADATFMGGLAGVIELSQLGVATSVLDAVFVGRDPVSGEIAALDLSTASADGTSAALIDFRLVAERRAALTTRTLTAHAGAVPAEVIDGLGAALEAGEAVVAVILAGPAGALDEAVERSGGRLVHDEPTAARALAACTTPTGVRARWTAAAGAGSMKSTP